MTHSANLYAGWWLYIGLIGLGATLFLTSYGGAFLWLGLIVLLAIALAGLYFWRAGFGPRRQLDAVLSADGLTLLGRGGKLDDLFIPWNQVAAVRLLPQPGYWETAIQSTTQPDSWLLAGNGLELAEEIATIADLPYAEHLQKAVNMGVEHHWQREV